MKSVEQNRTARTVAAATALAQSRQLPAFEKQRSELKSSVGDYDVKVPRDRDLGAFLQKITGLMNKHDLKEQLIQPGKELSDDQLSCIPVSMQCKGSLRQMFDFFRALQALDRLVRIQHVELSNAGDFSGEVSMRAETVVYYRAGSGAEWEKTKREKGIL
jgi:Tfp pilus assembly protein PilO